MAVLSLLFGSVVGFSLGLTGGGGAIFAVPLLVYGLAVDPHDAVTISLAAVGATSLAGAIGRLRARQVDVRTGLLFSAAGFVGAPAGTWIGRRIPDDLLLTLFAVLMIFVAVRMWRRAARAAPPGGGTETCARDAAGHLVYTRRCALVMTLVGVATGLLAGIFGVGGGFVIVPALVLVTGMSIHRAVATSLLVISVVSATGLVSHLVTGEGVDVVVTALFVAGGVGGMELGTRLGTRFSGPRLQRTFAGAILLVAAFVIRRSAG